MGFPVVICMSELDQKVGWVLKNWCFQIVVLEKTLESPLDCKEIKPVNPKRNQLWIFIGRTDAETETPILWPPDAKSRLIGKDPNEGKDWGQEEKGAAEMRWLDSITDSVEMNLNKLQELVASLVAQTVTCPPTMQETRVWFLDREDPLEKEMATHSSTLAWKNPMDRGAWWATVHGVAKSQTQLSNLTFTFFSRS